jgi:hypothetical protein
MKHIHVEINNLAVATKGFHAAAQDFCRAPNHRAVADLPFAAAIMPIVAAEIPILP